MKGFNLKANYSKDSEKIRKEKTCPYRDIPSATGLLTTKNKNKSCLFCSVSDHASACCEQAKKMPLSERQELVKRQYACFNCLNVGHSCRQCRVNVGCAWCFRRYVTLMCLSVGKKTIMKTRQMK